MSGAYYAEPFSDDERVRLSPFVSNLDSPVFALTGLPQVTCAALFARYSRSAKSLRRLLLDEFLTGASGEGAAGGAGSQKASDLFSRVLSEYGDDSVAQLGGVHIACEQVSQPLAKAIEWGRLAAYLEQSTRYIPYTDKRDGRYRYFRDPELMTSPVGGEYAAAMDRLFETYAALLAPLQEHLDRETPELGDASARKRAIRALALDIARALLPAGTVSNVGVFASPQSLEQMVMRLRAHSLPECRAYAELIATELQATIPDFVSRLDRSERGGRWVEYLRDLHSGIKDHALQMGITDTNGTGHRGVRLLEWDGDAEQRIVVNALFEFAHADRDEIGRAVAGMSADDFDRVWSDVVGDRGNRRHRPGRGFEHTAYTFEIVSDYGAFRDLQRHRMLTISWQRLTPALGYEIHEQIAAAGLADRWRHAVDIAETAYGSVNAEFPEQAQYLVTLGHRIRYVMRLTAREAMHMIELRTSPQAHPSYRQICQEMHRQIAEVAGHHRIAQAMKFVGSDDIHLPRYAAEAKMRA